MANFGQDRVVSAVSTGRGVLVAFESGVEALFEADFLVHAAETGQAVLISKRRDDAHKGLHLQLPDTA